MTDTNSALFSSPSLPPLLSPAGKPIAGLLPQGDRDEARLRGGMEQPRLRLQRATGMPSCQSYLFARTYLYTCAHLWVVIAVLVLGRRSFHMSKAVLCLPDVYQSHYLLN